MKQCMSRWPNRGHAKFWEKLEVVYKGWINFHNLANIFFNFSTAKMYEF